jgi:ribulose bisphosphate carboxylase small subunit
MSFALIATWLPILTGNRWDKSRNAVLPNSTPTLHCLDHTPDRYVRWVAVATRRQLVAKEMVFLKPNNKEWHNSFSSKCQQNLQIFLSLPNGR